MFCKKEISLRVHGPRSLERQGWSDGAQETYPRQQQIREIGKEGRNQDERFRQTSAKSTRA